MSAHKDILFAFDLDNTVFRNHDTWDRIFKETSLALFGVPLLYTRHVDGTLDTHFTSRNLRDTLSVRLQEAQIPEDALTFPTFLDRFNTEALRVRGPIKAEKFDGVDAFIEHVGDTRRFATWRPAIVTAGDKCIQIRALEALKLLNRFDMSYSFFQGDKASKVEALAWIAQTLRPHALVYFGDTPADMQALCHPAVQVQEKIAVGVTVAKLVTPDMLRDAGAHLILDDFRNGAFQKLRDFLVT
ncbi:MAG: hypothetical protein A2664_00810 [Candidatus Taylorbacteria bacterium RIFCSPHIGHO2_01_FULL_46_22b]|uniref:Haloacid dehalogenase n=1 Tax=Candidatus Taylorbacteria bacterium RIFCSPHIGHO2_01_FULL_46_22b TaxID=1802301 RepID=A0A1G2M5S4_9BACT|nr:MAG: hypothetical protein A2664_00810 [Candidatus Taylorbacteria bacterium RIFCSPHIGHO2_01_FULL_46_22b]